MKITPIAAPMTSVQPEGSANQPARARAIAALTGGNVSVTAEERPPEPKEQMNVKKIKMRTNATPLSNEEYMQSVNENGSQKPDILDANIEPQASSEETKPLSPQFAALARQKRALQLERQEIAKMKADFETSKSALSADEFISKADIIANPLKVFEAGVTYDQLTEALLEGQKASDPRVAKLMAKIEALEKGLENQNKSLSERDQQAEQQVLSHIEREASQLVASDSTFELVKEAGPAAIKETVKLIKKIYDTEGYVMDTTEALGLVEQDFLDQSLKFARLGKVQSKLGLSQQQPVQTGGKQQMKTLTARDGAQDPQSRKERAMTAFYGGRK